MTTWCAKLLLMCIGRLHTQHYAARAGHLAAAEVLLRAGASVCACTTAGHATALHRAAAAGKTDMVMLLLTHHALNSARDCDGRTPLHKVWSAVFFFFLFFLNDLE